MTIAWAGCSGHYWRGPSSGRNTIGYGRDRWKQGCKVYVLIRRFISRLKLQPRRVYHEASALGEKEVKNNSNVLFGLFVNFFGIPNPPRRPMLLRCAASDFIARIWPVSYSITRSNVPSSTTNVRAFPVPPRPCVVVFRHVSNEASFSPSMNAHLISRNRHL